MEIEFNTQATETAIQKIIQYGYLAVFSLLKHENKLSVMHCNVQRNDLTGDSSIIKSKEELYFQVQTGVDVRSCISVSFSTSYQSLYLTQLPYSCIFIRILWYQDNKFKCSSSTITDCSCHILTVLLCNIFNFNGYRLVSVLSPQDRFSVRRI